jgi:transcription initiation factor IIF auxiliary subunit
MSVSFSNYSTRLGAQRYNWCVFVNGDKATLDRITKVRYQLHPTFPNPIRVNDDRNHRFALESNGWGEFALWITVTYADGTNENDSYWLKLFDENWPKKQRPSAFSTKEEERVYDVLAEGQHRWRKLNTMKLRTGLKTKQLLAALGRLENANLIRKAPVRSIDQQEMWGTTEIVGVMPRL